MTDAKPDILATVKKYLGGIIQESNSSLIVKDGDGTDIKLTILKTPISLDNLKCQYEDKTQKTNKKICEYNAKFKHRLKLLERIKRTNDPKLANVSLLKEPISMDRMESNSSITFNVKTFKGIYSYNTPKKQKNAIEYQTWKQNALTVFEYSYVYPFVHASNKYKCFICSKPFLDANLLKEHTNKHSVKEIRQELNNKVREKHVKVDVTYLRCKICSDTSPNLQALKIHLKNHGKHIDPDFQDNLIPFKLGDSTFQCQVCGDAYLKLRLLIIHMSKHFNNYSCEICGSVFISLNLLKRHLQTHETGSFPCDKCDKVFSNTAKKTLHMRGVHLKQFPRRCPICPERFNSNYQRTKHLRIVHNQTTGLFRCETCGREYDLKYHLLIHIRSVHLQERNQECPICSSRFFSKYCLSRHMVIHTGEKNFKCEVCGKAYARRKNLREHSRIHDRAHTCSVCGLNYEDEVSLVAHVNTAHGVL